MISPDSFRDTMRAWATGAAIMTAQAPTQQHRMTVNSLTSVSLDPLLILICAQNNLRLMSFVHEPEAFARPSLRADQAEGSKRFADRDTEYADRFDGIERFAVVTGAPIPRGALAYITSWLKPSTPAARIQASLTTSPPPCTARASRCSTGIVTIVS